MKKFLLLGFIVLQTLAYARMVDGVALIVEGEAVTTAEINAVKKQMRISKKQAIDILIQDRLQKSAMRDIFVDEFTVDKQIASIAKQNNLSIKKMQKIIKKQGTPWRKYRQSIKESIQKDRFFNERVASSIPSPSESELKRFYQKNKSAFSVPSSFRLIEYSAKTEKAMNAFLLHKKKKNIKSRTLTKKTKNLSSSILNALLQSNKGSYTPSFNAGDKCIAYKVLSKSGRTSMPYEASRSAVEARWKQSQRGKAIKNYFNKVRTQADIQILRK